MTQQYFYKAMDRHGRIVQGQLTANNTNDLEARLERMGLDLIHCHIKKPHHFQIGKVSRHELITFCFHMDQLTRAGVPLIEGLSDLRDSLPQTRFREVISTLIENIQGGERLSEAMTNFPDLFDRVFVSLIRAGEETGKLTVVFNHLTETLKWEDEMIARTKKLMIYPSVVGLVIIGLIFFLMIYLVPQLIGFIKSVGGQLPLHTRILLFVSDIFVQYWYLIVTVPVVAFVALKAAMKISPRVRFKMDHLKLRIWLFGPIVEKIILARFATFFALLYGSGITVLESLNISKALAGNVVIEAALQQVTDNIAEGKGITESFERAKLFPPLILRMVKIGESTGELDTALLNVSYFYNREVKDSIDKIQVLIEPTMTVILGFLLGWVMLSVLGPIYDTIAGFKPEQPPPP
jgi:type IV pilus assembly protein PilC